MIFTDDKDFPVDETGDGMDSAVRAGILGMTKGHSGTMFDYRDYEVHYPQKNWGLFLRHPIQYPAKNYNNYTRDQAKVFLAGLHRIAKDCPGINYRLMAKRFFWKRFRSFFFMQNTERDRIGSRKKLRPHVFYKDSQPFPDTFDLKWNWKTFKFDKFEIPLDKLAPGRPLETRYIDGPDPMTLNDVGQAILVGEVWQFYWLIPFCYICHFISLILNRWSSHEQNQIYCESYVYGTLGLYTWLQPRWKDLLRYYWGERNEMEYADLMIRFAENPK